MMIKYATLKIFEKIKVLKKLNLTTCVTLNEKRIIIPIIKGLGITNLKPAEEWMQFLFKNILPIKNGAFIDIGANLGQTLIKIKSIKENIHYFGFEPNPSCVFYLRELIEKNRFKNCDIIPIAISDMNGLVQLDLYTNEVDSSASIIKDFRKAKVNYKSLVPTFKFEKIFKPSDFKAISIVKIDVEGAELEVLKSMKKTLAKHRPFIICEILPVYETSNVFRLKRQKEVESILKNINYLIFRILEKGKIIPIGEIGVHSDLKLCNYLFIPSEYLVVFQKG